jgi:hypothetical protein
MKLLGLGYVGLNAPDASAWENFGVESLGPMPARSEPRATKTTALCSSRWTRGYTASPSTPPRRWVSGTWGSSWPGRRSLNQP